MHSTQLRRCLRRVCLTFPPLLALVDGPELELSALGVVLRETSLLGDALEDMRGNNGRDLGVPSSLQAMQRLWGSVNSRTSSVVLYTSP